MLREEGENDGQTVLRRGSCLCLRGFSKGLDKIQINGCSQDSHAEVQPSGILQKGKNDSTHAYLEFDAPNSPSVSMSYPAR